MKTVIRYIRTSLFAALALMSFSAFAQSLAPSYHVERNGAQAAVQFSYDAAEHVLTARIQRDGQTDHVYTHSLSQMKLDVAIGDRHVMTVQGHTPTMAGYIDSDDLSVGEETTPSQIWQFAGARQLRVKLGDDIDIFRALPNRELMNIFIGPYVLATGDIGRVLGAAHSDFHVVTPPSLGPGRFRASTDMAMYLDPVECAAYAACYWGCVAGGGGWIDCGPYCHNQQGC